MVCVNSCVDSLDPPLAETGDPVDAPPHTRSSEDSGSDPVLLSFLFVALGNPVKFPHVEEAIRLQFFNSKTPQLFYHLPNLLCCMSK
jgi:hypothetical protein